jgi:hypothetical protein
MFSFLCLSYIQVLMQFKIWPHPGVWYPYIPKLRVAKDSPRAFYIASVLFSWLFKDWVVIGSHDLHGVKSGTIRWAEMPLRIYLAGFEDVTCLPTSCNDLFYLIIPFSIFYNIWNVIHPMWYPYSPKLTVANDSGCYLLQLYWLLVSGCWLL